VLGVIATGLRYFLVAALVAVASGCERGPTPTPAGRELFLRYCASCHGADGKGGGPVAGALRKPPADLTQLAKKAGRFDEAAVVAIIDGRRSVAEHGPREMPVWGAVFDEALKDRSYREYTNLLQSKVLAEYVASIQEK
jgi:mono/diheme cytochrome c family protein